MKALCPYCDRHITVDRRGLFRKHGSASAPCAGSGCHYALGQRRWRQGKLVTVDEHGGTR